MKFAAVVLLACVAVSSAAFTGSLVQRTKPSVDKAMFQLRLVAGGNKNQFQEIVGQIVDNVQQQITNIIQTAGELTDAAQNLAQQVQSQVASALNALAAAGQNAGQTVSSIILNLIESLQDTLGLNKNLDLPQILEHVQAAINTAIQTASNLIGSINLNQLLQNAVNTVLGYLPPQVAALINAQLNLSQKNLFGTLGQLWNNIVSQVTGAASSVANTVGQVISQLQSAGQATIQNLQSELQAAIANGTNILQGFSNDAILAIQAQIQSFAGVLGNQYGAFVQMVNQAAQQIGSN